MMRAGSLKSNFVLCSGALGKLRAYFNETDLEDADVDVVDDDD